MVPLAGDNRLWLTTETAMLGLTYRRGTSVEPALLDLCLDNICP